MKRTRILAVMFAGPLALFLSVPSIAQGGRSGTGIVIQSDADFISCGCVSSGTGSKADPYLIGSLSINNVTGTAVSIDGANLTKSFRLLNLTVSGNGAVTSQVNFLVATLPGTPTLIAYGPPHDNVLSGNFSNASGPTGSEVKNHLAPAFLGGIVVLNGTYNNTITGNTIPSATGSSLAWAQVVPDNQSPIGVVTEPPTLHCNVTASEGGGGPLNFNGNVWSGNTFKTADSCIPNP